MGRGDWRSTVHRVAKSQTRLKPLNTHSISSEDWKETIIFVRVVSVVNWTEKKKKKVKVSATQACPTLCDPRTAAHSPAKNTGVGSHLLLQEIFPTQGLNPGLPHYRQSLYHWATGGAVSTDAEFRGQTPDQHIALKPRTPGLKWSNPQPPK